MQQLVPYPLAKEAELADLGKKLTADNKRAKLNQMVRHLEELGVSSWHFPRADMVHIFNEIILPRITDRET